jgi:hypothetical protein
MKQGAGTREDETLKDLRKVEEGRWSGRNRADMPTRTFLNAVGGETSREEPSRHATVYRPRSMGSASGVSEEGPKPVRG